MKTAEQAGGYAFPCPAGTGADNGMTLRDYFAAKAMQAYIASQIDMTHDDTSEFAEDVTAKIAYQFADAMLKARKTA